MTVEEYDEQQAHVRKLEVELGAAGASVLVEAVWSCFGPYLPDVNAELRELSGDPELCRAVASAAHLGGRYAVALLRTADRWRRRRRSRSRAGGTGAA